MHDVLVIGGGHAGIEAAAAAARLGARTALVTQDPAAVGRLSCNPAIGGVGKGHLVRELHALGGLMAGLADRAGIQFRLLNTSRGPAVRGPRAQVDRERYPLLAQRELGRFPIDRIAGEVRQLIFEEQPDGRLRCLGAELAEGALRASTVVLASGTFLGGVLHLGEQAEPGGRRGEPAATELARTLRARGLAFLRFKTGTPPRLHRDSIDWSRTRVQPGDEEPCFFCPETLGPALPQVPCHAIYTGPEAHSVIRENLHRSPMYAGRILGRGPRYCPSFEEKVERFADRERHLLLLEPESLESDQIYVNGASTSLPAEVQREFIRRVPGLERAEIAQPGYAVEYDSICPKELRRSLELAAVPGLYLAGQVMGTTGYEEAAGLGLMAGANAALAAQGRPEWLLGRHESYLGVMVDDLVTRGLDEPYRMFTSRAEQRLLLGIDSADLRLSPQGAAIGLVSPATGREAELRHERVRRAKELLESLPGEGGRPLSAWCRRPEVDLGTLLERIPVHCRLELGRGDREQRQSLVEAGQRLRYDRYVQRQERAAERLSRAGEHEIPSEFVFWGLPGLSREVQERLSRSRPLTLRQAARLPGLTPGALQVLEAHLARPPAVPRGTPASEQP